MLILNDKRLVEPVSVAVTTETLSVGLSDGRTINVPTAWFPRLAHGTPQEWAIFELGGLGIHWPELNEDISVEGLLNGERSGESARSIERWLDLRRQGKKEYIPHLPLPPDMALELERIDNEPVDEND